MAKEITYKTVQVTPSMAESWLEKNLGNRPISKHVVSKYAEGMKRGHWNLTHQAIAFDKNGNLVDGQHRLYAVIMAGIPVMMVVAFYPDKLDPFSLILDGGKIRNVSDLTGFDRREVEIMRMWLNVFYPLNSSKADICDYKRIYSVAKDCIRKTLDAAPTTKRTLTSAPIAAAVAFELLIENDWTENFKKLVSDVEGDKKIDNIKNWLKSEIEYYYGMAFRRYAFGSMLCMIESKDIIYPTQIDAEQKIIDSKPFFDDIIKLNF